MYTFRELDRSRTAGFCFILISSPIQMELNCPLFFYCGPTKPEKIKALCDKSEDTEGLKHSNFIQIVETLVKK